MKLGILLIGHGSKVDAANEVLDQVALMLKRQTGAEIVEVAFYGMLPPNVQAGIDACVARGATRILLYPYFLVAGAHVLNDLPKELDLAGQRHPGLELALCKPLGVHPKLVDVICDRLEEALTETGWTMDP